MIYLDNAATSWPKAPGVAEAMARFLQEEAGNPGRSGHRLARAAAHRVEAARRALARLLGVSPPERIVFTLNTTDALNLALKGLLRPGDHVITSSVEHNSVTRPLRALADEGVQVTKVPCFGDGTVDVEALSRAFRPNSRLVVLTHASNVTGAIQPVAEVARLAHEAGAWFLVDGAQTVGALPIRVADLGADLLAFPGHKGLLGPTGTGGLYVGPGVELRPSREGGTGTASEMETQPPDLPHRLESGTPNTVGLAGLGAALEYVEARGVEDIRQHEMALVQALREGLREVPGLRLYGPEEPEHSAGAVSFTLPGLEPAEVAAILDATFDVAVRPGLHCSPDAHRTLGTFPLGTVRLSVGPFNTLDEVHEAVACVAQIAHTAA
ncbi:MAG: aminotransferase class V-fold PLP-dependent enzyme [Anaerolineae bacterium]|nr:aminotransferase class V-fold PLP-dependent enzyme [Anaerolineae bacterium]